jgi:nucleotide-binding universal stress UspA family protein
MKTIIITTDFSKSSLHAANYACDLAEILKADIVMLHVYRAPVVYSEIPTPIDYESFNHHALESLNHTRMELLDTHGALNIELEVKEGFFFDALNVLCEQVKPYLVVMGTQGKSATEHFFLGEHTLYAMKHLQYPILAIPPNATFSYYEKIGFATDFDHVITTTPAKQIIEFVTHFNTELHIIHVGEKEKFDSNVVFGSGIIQELFYKLSPIYDLIDGEDTDESILDFVNTNKIDLLIVIPKRHDIIDRIIHKSNTKQLVAHAQVPILAIHEAF